MAGDDRFVQLLDKYAELAVAGDNDGVKQVKDEIVGYNKGTRPAKSTPSRLDPLKSVPGSARVEELTRNLEIAESKYEEYKDIITAVITNTEAALRKTETEDYSEEQRRLKRLLNKAKIFNAQNDHPASMVIQLLDNHTKEVHATAAMLLNQCEEVRPETRVEASMSPGRSPSVVSPTWKLSCSSPCASLSSPAISAHSSTSRRSPSLSPAQKIKLENQRHELAMKVLDAARHVNQNAYETVFRQLDWLRGVYSHIA